MLALIPISLLHQLLLLPISIDGVDVLCETAACKTVAKMLDQNVDMGIDPCEDFYSYACGGFLRRYQGQQELDEPALLIYKTEDQTHKMFQTIEWHFRNNIRMPGLERVPDPIINIVYGMYQKCMERHFHGTWAQELQDIFHRELGQMWPQLLMPSSPSRPCDTYSFSQFLAKSHKLNMLYYNFAGVAAPAIFTPLVQTISHSSPVHILRMEVQVDMRYIKQEVEQKVLLFKTVLSEFISATGQHIQDDGTIERAIRNIVEFEHDLLYWLKTQALDKKTDVSYYQFEEMVEGAIDLKAYLREFLPRGVIYKLLNADTTPIRISERHYFEQLGSVFHKYPCDVWYNYVYYKLIEGSHHVQSQRLQRNCVHSLAESPLRVGMATLYLHINHSDQNSWNSVRDMAVAIRKEMQQMIVDAKWMTIDARHLAREKERRMSMVTAASSLFYNTRNLNDFHRVIIIDYDPAKNYYQNRRLLATWYMELMMKRIGSSDPICANDIWYERYALDIVAEYQIHTNQFILTPGIMRDPIYHKDYPAFYNFGVIGSIIGHEVTHGFDTFGRQFDLHGVRKDWSDNSTDENFQKRANCFIQQYGNQRIEALPGTIYINGKKTLAENIADNGGIRSSFEAYRKWKHAQDEKNIKVPRPKFELESLNIMDTERLFFISSAQMQCKVISEARQIDRLRSHFHSPSKYRVNIPLQNFESFSNVFRCKLGTTNMNPNTKCKIW